MVHRFALCREDDRQPRGGLATQRLWFAGRALGCRRVAAHDLPQRLDFSKEDRDENVRRIGFVCGLLARHGVVVLVSAIAPYREVRAEIRARLGRFVEVYVNAPLAVCEGRDVKGLYRRARSGRGYERDAKRARARSGLAPYEASRKSPDVECRTDLETVEQSAAKVVAFLRTNYAELFLP